MEGAEIALLCQKGDPEIPENYRPLSFLNTLFKFSVVMMRMRIGNEVKNDIAQTQFGFRERNKRNACNLHSQENPKISRETRLKSTSCDS